MKYTIKRKETVKPTFKAGDYFTYKVNGIAYVEQIICNKHPIIQFYSVSVENGNVEDVEHTLKALTENRSDITKVELIGVEDGTLVFKEV